MNSRSARHLHGERGITLIDTIVGTALMLTVFLGITAAFQLSLDVVTNNRVRAGAIALLNERMEYLRSLSYTQIGVEGGIPAGIVPQTETVSWNGTDYTRRTSVLYSDDSADGLGVADQNGIIADYKTIRVEVSWTSRQGERSIVLVGRVSPFGVESAVSGGILTIQVVNASAVPVSDAQVDIVNTETSPAINIRTYTNTNGLVSFIGAPAASNYQITVSRPGYSTAQTYSDTAENPDPNPRHLSVVDNETTSSTFSIDVTSTKSIETYKLFELDDFVDSFNTSQFISATSSVDVVGGEAVLAGGAPYSSPGSIRSTTITPSTLIGWDSLSWQGTEPAQTAITLHVYDSSNTLIPDSELPGNSVGFTSSPVSIAGISASTYPSLRIGADLSTDDTNETPILQSWDVSYRYGPVMLPDLPFTMHGLKTIGNSPTIYKYDEDQSSGSGASITLLEVEWDTYLLSVATTTGYNLAESCDTQPEVLAPGTTQTTKLYVLPYTPNTLLVDVRGDDGALITDASVRVYDANYDETFTTSSCGQIFFDNLTAGTYSIIVSKSGYQSYSNSTLNISGASKTSVILSAL